MFSLFNHVLLGVLLLITYGAGAHNATIEFQHEAINAHVASMEFISPTGELEFTWKLCAPEYVEVCSYVDCKQKPEKCFWFDKESQ